ncbi:permease family protein [Asticcacaulis biprosthecium C19]|uniref:Permease family protein n=1 Tax=Asticcacaulis biprosthecium C19 TaxID=715226 RepID=F4QLN2_9CAUL|nr:ABC transporter permease [Asticcacaulis biprosthecium]EGF93530.1 permease family protein [Asticcacaulis biprosthecium C19]
MIRSFLIAFYRTTARHPLYAVLNVLGLSFGVAVFIVISLYVHFEATFDAWMPKADRIHEITTTRLVWDDKAEPDFASAGVALDAVRAAVPRAPSTQVVTTWSIFQYDGEPVEEEEYLVSAGFFDVFDLPLVAGSKTNALTPDSIVISEAKARKYFGHTDVVGRRIVLRDMIVGVMDVPQGASVSRVYTVTAVLADTPPNSSLRFHFVRLLTPQRAAAFPHWDNWDVSTHRTFVALDGAKALAEANARLDAFVDSHGRSPAIDAQFPGRPRHERLRLRAFPLAKEHLADRKAMAPILALGTLGILAFAIALLNYVNLATARTMIRAREAALRRTLGATEGTLRLQFLGEAALVSLMAVVLGFSLVELALPLVNNLGGTSLRLSYLRTWPFLVGLTTAVLLCGAMAGLYPAFLMAAYRPAAVFASTRTPSGGRLAVRLREILVFLQFTLVTAFLIVVIGFATQLRHIQTSNLGFDREGLLITNALTGATFDPGKISAITSQWVALPNVVSLSSGVTPGPYYDWALLPIRRTLPGAQPVDASVLMIGDHYFNVFEAKLLAGRVLTRDDQVIMEAVQAANRVPITINVVINRRAAQAYGFSSPEAALGQDLIIAKRTLHIVGVVADQRFGPPSEPIVPLVFYSMTQMQEKMSTILRYDGVSEDVMRARMISVWRRLAPDLPLDLVSGNESLEHYYEADRRITRLFVMGACLVGLIGVIGLYGMAAFNTSARSVEIGLRKAMGGSRPRITGLLVTQFLRPVVLANLVAWPTAWWVLDHWLGQFDDRVALSPIFFLLGSGIALLIAVMTVVGLTWNAAGSAPGKTLRHE